MLGGSNNEVGIALLVGGAGLFGVGWSARDNRVSSEDVGQDEGARRRRESLGRFIPALLVLAGVMVGCQQPISDRGSLGETLATPNIQIGTIFNAGQPLPSVAESSTGFHQPGFDVVMTELESQIAAVTVALADARAAKDADAVATLTARLDQLTTAKASISQGVGSSAGVYTFVMMRDVNTPATGTSEAASPGDTSQPTQMENTGELSGLPGG